MENQRDTARGIGAGILLLGAMVAALLLPPRPPAPEAARASTSGMDSGLDAIRLAELGLSGEVRGGWMRLRGVDLAKVPETREALGKLRLAGWRTCVLLRLSVKDWKTKYLPDDLRETYENRRRLGAAFGDLMDAWEVDNEPDLGFVPESAERYTAFLKASWLGLKRGIEENAQDAPLSGARDAPLLGARTAQLSVEGYELLGPSDLSPKPITNNRGGAAPNNQQPITNNSNEPMVLMGSLGLPPGPWLERFAVNDGFAYTDGYNYHYYGYADDFTGVYRQHERAVAQLLDESYQLLGSAAGSSEPLTNNKAARPTNNLRQKNLPVFLTELGFGMLGKEARDTKDGRVRQWRWFKSVGEQIATLRIEAPMAFYLQPYLEYGLYEYGLTVPAVPSGTAELSVKSYELSGSNPNNQQPITINSGAAAPNNSQPLTNNRAAGATWSAGGIEYEASDFSEVDEIANNRAAGTPWMGRIGEALGKNEITPALAWWIGAPRGAQWLASERDGQRAKSKGLYLPNASRTANRPPTTGHRWSVSTPPTSPIVLDFLAGEGMHPIKRYNGSFVTAKEAVTKKKPEAGDRKPEEAKPQTPAPKSKTPPTRAEEFMIQVRTQNGSLYEVYPTRMATPDWQHYLEPHDNFTMSFYGRAEPDWRLADNRLASLVFVMYPKQLPAVFEFRRPLLLRLGTAQGVKHEAGNVGGRPPSTGPVRYGRGQVLLYNFSNRPITGKLVLPEGVTTDTTDFTESITLAAGERRAVEIGVVIPAERYERVSVEVVFLPDDAAIASARFRTDFIPDIGGMKATVVASLLPRQEQSARNKESATSPLALRSSRWANAELVATRPRATEEAPMGESFDSAQDRQSAKGEGPDDKSADGNKSASALVAFAQEGATVESTPGGLRVTVTGMPAGKVQRIEAEIPWPDGLEFVSDEFLSLEFRLGN